MKGRPWSAEETLAIVLEGITGAKPVAEICREHQMAQTQYDQWRDRFLEGGQRALPNGIPNTEEARDAIAQWIAGDDNQRDVHSPLGYRSPLEFEATLRRQEAAHAAASDDSRSAPHKVS
jgi:transposase